MSGKEKEGGLNAKRCEGPHMTTNPITHSQRSAAKVVGVSYLFAMVTGVFAEFYARGQLVVANEANQTAQNIIAHETLWRLGIANNLLCVLTDVALITALYIILKPINRNLALFAAFVRVIETAVDVATTLRSFDVLKILSGVGYLKAFTPDQLHALARTSVSAYAFGIDVAFLFLGVGSMVFCYLWYQSRYIPRALAMLGMVGSLFMAVGTFLIIIFPGLESVLSIVYMLPLGVFEVTMGFWMLVKGLTSPVVVESNQEMD